MTDDSPSDSGAKVCRSTHGSSKSGSATYVRLASRPYATASAPNALLLASEAMVNEPTIASSTGMRRIGSMQFGPGSKAVTTTKPRSPARFAFGP